MGLAGNALLLDTRRKEPISAIEILRIVQHFGYSTKSSNNVIACYLGSHMLLTGRLGRREVFEAQEQGEQKSFPP